MNQKRVPLLSHSIVYLLPLVVLVFFTGSVKAGTFCVSTAVDLQSALTSAASNGEDDLVRIEQGTYFGNFLYGSVEAFAVTIEGGYVPGCGSRVVDPANTVLDGQTTGNVLALSAPQATGVAVDGVTLQNGTAPASQKGAGLFVSTPGAVVTITNTAANNNSATDGGGIFVDGFSLTLDGLTVSNNEAGFEGGGIRAFGTTVSITDCIVSNNFAGFGQMGSGGGIWANAGTVTIANNTVTGNVSDGISGGIHISGSIVTVDHNTISGNAAGVGFGGINSTFGTMLMTNNTVSNNTGGGAKFTDYDTAILMNNTFSNNTTTAAGGGANFGNNTNRPSTVTLLNNTFSNNMANQDGGGIHIARAIAITMTNNTFSNNTTTASGGGIHIRHIGESDLANIYNNTFLSKLTFRAGIGAEEKPAESLIT